MISIKDDLYSIKDHHLIIVWPLIRCQLPVAIKPVKSLGCVTVKEIMIIARDLDWQFGISNLAGDFNRNFFDFVQQICWDYSPLIRCQLPVTSTPLKSLGCVNRTRRTKKS